MISAGKQATLLYFDLDDFKMINDTSGHAEGDRALREFSHLRLDAFGDSDIVTRLGGDEFCVLFPGAGESLAQSAISRFEAAVALRNAKTGCRYDLVYSVGTVVYEPNYPPTPDALLARTDASIYEAKKLKKQQRGGVAQALGEQGVSLPGFVRDEFDAYMRGGRLEHGFLGAKCQAGRFEHLVAFSCKLGGFCPSCAARRMAASSNYLLEQVIPHIAMRQWVVSFPWPLRLVFAHTLVLKGARIRAPVRASGAQCVHLV